MRSLTVKTAAVATIFAFAAAAPLIAQGPRVPGAPPQQNAAAGPEEDVDGTLEVLVEDHADGARIHHFLDTNRGRMRLRDAAGSEQLAGLTTGTRIRARGRWAQDGTLELNPGGGSVTTMALASSTTFGQQRVAVIMVNFQDNAAQPYAWTHAHDVTFNQTNAFVVENSYGQTSLVGDVFGWFTIPMSSGVCDPYQLAALADQAVTNTGANLSTYMRKVYAFPTNACAWQGLGNIGGNPTRAWINGNYFEKVVAHELGHNFGDFHSNAQPCASGACTTANYGHDRDTMGAPGVGHFNAYQKERLGWLNYGSSPAIQTVTSSGTFFINSLQTSGTGAKALKILKAATSSGSVFYYVEARTQAGFDAGYAPGVLMTTGNSANGDSSLQVDFDPVTAGFDPMLDPGQSFADGAAGFTITTLSVETGGAWVRIEYAGQPCTDRAPTVTLSPGGTVTTQPGTPVSYTLTVANSDDASCAASEFSIAMDVPAGFAWTTDRASVSVGPGGSASASIVVTPPMTASGTSTLRGQAARTDGPSGTSSNVYLNVQAPITSIDASLRITTNGGQFTIAATVTGNGSPVSGAAVAFTLTDSRGGVTRLSATTGTNGIAQVRFKPNRKEPRGTFTVTASALWKGLSATAAGNFVN